MHSSLSRLVVLCVRFTRKMAASKRAVQFFEACVEYIKVYRGECDQKQNVVI